MHKQTNKQKIKLQYFFVHLYISNSYGLINDPLGPATQK